MRSGKWLFALMALLACGLIAAGCGDDDESSSGDSSATEESSDSSSDSSSSSGVSTPEDVKAACEDAIAGTPTEDEQAGCAIAADTFAKCFEEAEALGDSAAVDKAVKACQGAADTAVDLSKHGF